MKGHDKAKYVPALSFDFLTPIYDPIAALTTREKTFKREMVKQIAVQPAQRVLDLGCGTATLTVALKESCPAAEVFGLDGDAKILEIARRKTDKTGVEIKFKTGLSYKMPYEDAYFDSVVSSLFFHHLTPADKRKTLDEVFRVLKPGGVLLVGDWGKPANFLMRIVSMPVQWLDGATTRDSFQGMLPKFMTSAGFREVVETGSFNSVFGTIRLHKAVKG
jgi:ubiquinone/menaquinone biosynthesis C-methylase UbiE